MRALPLLSLGLFSVTVSASAATIEVGAGKAFTTLGAAAKAAQDGDIINIFPGVYTTGADWKANSLTIQAVPGTKLGGVVIKGTVNNKGVFDIEGDDATVIGLKFTYAHSTDGNGAGIRAEGHNITVQNCEFYGNEMGMLITPVPGKTGSTATIDSSVFDYTGTKVGTHIGHGVYAVKGNDLLSVTNSTFTRDFVGHGIKSRALSTYVHDNTVDDTNGTASYLINVPQGGAADIQNNILIKGSKASNCCIAISYGEEMIKGGTYVNPPGPVLVQNNQFTSYRNSKVTYFKNASTPPNPVALVGNTLTAVAGTIVPLVGPGTVD